MSYFAVLVDRAKSIGEMCHGDSNRFKIHFELVHPKGATLDKAVVEILVSHGVGRLTGVSQGGLQIAPLLEEEYIAISFSLPGVGVVKDAA